VILLASCASMVGASAPQAPTPAPVTAALGESFTLAAGQTAHVGTERMGITFEAVLSDSRCPTDVQCIRAGEAVVRAGAKAQGQAAETVELETTPGRAQVLVAGYTLTLTGVAPVPNTKVRARASDYRATFTLAKP